MTGTTSASASLAARTLQEIGTHGLIQTLNFHNTPADKAASYEAQLAGYAEQFRSVNEDDLERSFSQRGWPYTKPGLIVAFFNGYRNNYDVAAPLLERYGFKGWFFVPSGFLEVEPALQRTFAGRSKIRVSPGEYPDGRIAMSWDEARDLERRGHVIASHTRTHQYACARDLSTEDLHREIALSQGDFRAQLGHEVRAFAWIYGSGYGVNPEADAYLKASGYRYLFGNHKLHYLG